MHAADGWVPAEGFGGTKESDDQPGWVTVSETEEKQEITGD